MLTWEDLPCEGLYFGLMRHVVGRCCRGLVFFRPSWMFCWLVYQQHCFHLLLLSAGWTETVSEPVYVFKNTHHQPAWLWWREIAMCKVQATLCSHLSILSLWGLSRSSCGNTEPWSNRMVHAMVHCFISIHYVANISYFSSQTVACTE